MRHHEGPVRSRPRRAQRDQQVDAAGGDLLRTVQPLVAHDLEGTRLARRTEQARIREGLEERLHLALELAPHAPLRGVEQGPARADLDAVHQQQPPALRREQRALGALGRTARQRLERQRARIHRAQRLQRIHAVRDEALPLRIGEQAARPRAEPQQQFVVRARSPRRALLVEPRERACDRAAVGEHLRSAPQAVEGHDAREAHQRVLGAEIEPAQPLEGIVAAVPGRRRIHDQHRATLAAQARRHHQRAGTDVAVAGQRRYAHEVQVLDRREREQARARLGRADHVVVGERTAVIAVRIRIDVADRVPRAAAESLVRPRRRHRTADTHESRLLQRTGHVPGRAGRGRQAAEDLLVLDALGAVGAHALHDQVEAVGLVRADVVVIHRGAKHLARSRAERGERQGVVAAGQRDRGGGAAVHDPHDQRNLAAVLEVLLDGVGERARLPQAAEGVLELGEAADCDGAVHRTAQGASHEGRHGGGPPDDGVVGAGPFRDDDAAERRFAQDAPVCESELR